MANLKTLDETTRNPVDGTEFVRLATPGANWKAQLSSVSRRKLAVDTNYYVSVTGSDSNGGTNPSTDAWATLQHAMDVIGTTLDFALRTLTLNIGTGSFVGLGLKITIGGGILRFLGAGVALTSVTMGPNDGTYNGGECVSVYEPAGVTAYSFAELTIDSTGTYTGFGIYSDATVFMGDAISVKTLNIIVDNTQSGAAAYGQAPAVIKCAPPNHQTINVTFTPSSSSAFAGFFAQQDAIIELISLDTINVLGSPIFNQGAGFLSTQNGGTVWSSGATIVTTGATGVFAASTNNGSIFYDAAIPAGMTLLVDPSSAYNGLLGVAQGSGLPTGATFPPGTSGIYKDTSGGGVYSVYNDAGTIKKVALV